MAKTAELKDRFNQLNIDVWDYDFADGGSVADDQYIELYTRADAGASTVDLIAALALTYLNIHLLSI